MRCLTIELRDSEIEEFIRRKRLSPEDRNDPARFGAPYTRTSMTVCGSA
jgi:hypothetical protein